MEGGREGFFPSNQKGGEGGPSSPRLSSFFLPHRIKRKGGGSDEVVLSLAPDAHTAPTLPQALLLLLLSRSPGAHCRGITFDPIIANIERRREDSEWERAHFFPHSGGGDSAPAMEAQPEWEDFVDAEDYINDEDLFNVTHRIIDLFPKIDIGAADGFVSSDELTEWNLR